MGLQALGGSSQIIIKCRNNSTTLNVRKGDAITLVETGYDSDVGSAVDAPIFLAEVWDIATSGTDVIGVALTDADKGTAAGKGGYFHVCVFGPAQGRVMSSVAAGEKVAVGASKEWVGGTDVTANNGVMVENNIGTLVGTGIVGFALETGNYSSGAASNADLDTELSWVFVNGIGRVTYAAS